MHDWNDIIRQHGPGVWKVAWRLLGQESDVSDCFQETFLAAVRIAAREPVTNWSALLRRVATLQALKILQHRARSGATSLEDNPGPTGDEASPARQVEQKEQVHLLRAALAELPSDVAQVICLRYELQMSYAEIGQALGISVSHVGVLLHRGKQQLQTRLGGLLSDNP